jgi:Flp pilus assembly pilin Flp
MRMLSWVRRIGAPAGEAKPADQAPQTPTEEPAPPRTRRGVTALEYLVCASFIIVVLIVAIQHLGSLTGGLFRKSATATSTN